MCHKLIDSLFERADVDKEDSDFSYFFALLLAGEAMAKTIALGLIAAIDNDVNGNRYRIEHKLVRANGLGDWSDAVNDLLTGPASQYLISEVQQERRELTENCNRETWQYRSVSSLKSALDALGIEGEDLPERSDMKRWFRLLATLRNKTRGHGATRPDASGPAAIYLRDSLDLLHQNLLLFQRPWVYLYRNISGKYRVSSITSQTDDFDHLKRETHHSLPNGVYIHIGAPRLVPLLMSDPELSDFFLPNGSFSDRNFELLSFATDDKQTADSAPYLIDPGSLFPSETAGHGELLPKGSCFSNVPEPAPRLCVASTVGG